MKEDDLLYILDNLSCYEVTKEGIIRFLIDTHYITMSGSDFENEIITDALSGLNWTYICSVQNDKVLELDDEEVELEDEEGYTDE